MKPLLQKIKTQLNSKAAVWVVLFLAIVNKSLISLIYTSLKGDKALYLLLSKGLLQTGKLLEPVPVVERGAVLYFYDPAAMSPLYSLLAAPFLWLTNSFFWTQFILSIAGWVLFFPAVYLLAKAVLQQRWRAVLFVLFTAFFLYPHELSSTTKDTLAVSLSLWSILLMHRWLQTKPRWTTTLLLAITLFSLALSKLLYLPLVAVFVFLLFLSLALQKSRVHFIHFCLLGVVLLLGAVFMKQWLAQASYLSAHTQLVRLPSNTSDINIGFTPENLLSTYPFISSSFINTHLWAVQLGKLTKISFTTVMKSFLCLDALLLVVLIAASLVYSRKLLSNNRLLFLIVASVVMMMVPVFLSVGGNVVKYKSNEHFWTYVMDSRSFWLPMLCIQLVSFLAIFSLHKRSILTNVVCVLFLLTALHGIYFTTKESVSSRFGTVPKKGNDALDQLANTLSHDTSLTLVATDHFLRRYMQVKGLPVFAFSNLPPNFSWMKKGQQCLVVTYPADSAFRRRFAEEKLLAVDTLRPFYLHLYQSK